MFDSGKSQRWNLCVAVVGFVVLILLYFGSAGPSGSGVRNMLQKIAFDDDEPTLTLDNAKPTIALGHAKPTVILDDENPTADVEDTTVSDAEIPDDSDEVNFLALHESFQDDLPNPNPSFHTHKLRTYRPHNYAGPGQKSFATVLSTRHGSMHDPYFAAAQQLVYRMLWDPKIKSKHLFTVFVAPFIPDEQRDLLTAAGADVRELDLVQWNASALTNARWRDLFIKLNIWEQTDFERVVLLDTDAFPIENIDGIFDVLEEQKCDRDKLVDMEDIDEVCDYGFAAVEHVNGEFNAGVLVAKPNKAMHARLIRHMQTEDFSSGLMEQSFLNQFFRRDGPFPAQLIDRQWNGFLPQEDEEGRLKVFHDKLWMVEKWEDRNVTWAEGWFNQSWDDMIRLYNSPEFEQLRANDGERLY